MRVFMHNYKMYRAFGCGVFSALRRAYKAVGVYKRHGIKG